MQPIAILFLWRCNSHCTCVRRWCQHSFIYLCLSQKRKPGFIRTKKYTSGPLSVTQRYVRSKIQNPRDRKRAFLGRLNKPWKLRRRKQREQLMDDGREVFLARLHHFCGIYGGRMQTVGPLGRLPQLFFLSVVEANHLSSISSMGIIKCLTDLKLIEKRSPHLFCIIKKDAVAKWLATS